jgi:hypothetical protein
MVNPALQRSSREMLRHGDARADVSVGSSDYRTLHDPVPRRGPRRLAARGSRIQPAHQSIGSMSAGDKPEYAGGRSYVGTAENV